MKNQPQQAPPGESVSIHQLVARLQQSLSPQVTGKKSFIVNDVDKCFAVAAEENALSYVIGSLLSNAVYNSTASCIRVEAAAAGNQLQIRIRNNSVAGYCGSLHTRGNFVEAAKKIGGNIGLETEGNNTITFVFSITKNAA